MDLLLKINNRIKLLKMLGNNMGIMLQCTM